MTSLDFDKLFSNEGLTLSHMQEIFDHHLIMTITDHDGIILYANQKFLDIMKYTFGEVVGNTHSLFKSNSHPFKFYEEMWNTIKDGKIWKGALRNKTKDGRLVWLKTTIIPIIKNNSITHYISIRNDLSENVQLSEKITVAQKILKEHNFSLENELEENRKMMKQQKLSTIGELASRMAHDIRNPLSVITVSLENIQLVLGNNKDVEKNIHHAKNAIYRITHQIEEVLDFIKTKPSQKQSLKIATLVDEIIDTSNHLPSISIEKSLDDSQIIFDQTMFFVLIKNILFNAIQACGESGTIKISSGKLEGHTILEISDSGPGIPQDILSKIFEPLFTTKQHGTGLGLASCKSIMEQHGGKITVKNKPTTFTIHFAE